VVERERPAVGRPLDDRPVMEPSLEPGIEGPLALGGAPDPGLAPPSATPGGALLRSSALVGIGTMLSRATGLIRVVVLLRALGGGGAKYPLAEAYNLANTTPNMIYDLLLGGVLSATLVPIFVDLLHDDDDDGISAVLTIGISVLVAITTVTMIAAPFIFRLYVLGKGPAEAGRLAAAGVPLLRFFLPQILFYGLTAMATALLNARRSFLAPAFAPVLNNLVVIAVLFTLPLAVGGQLTLDRVLHDKGLLVVLGLGTTAGIVAMSAALLPALRGTGIRFRPNFDWHHPAMRRMVRLSGWTLGYVAVNQLSFLVITILAANVDGVTPYAYGFAFFQLPYGLFAVSIMTTFEPDLAAMASDRDLPGFRQRFLLGLRSLLVVILPAAAGCFVLAQPLLGSLTLAGGAFRPEQAQVIGDTLAMFALGLPGFSVYLYTLRAFYALKNTRFPFFAAVLQNGLNVVFGVVLYELDLGVQGLAFAYSLSYTTAAVVAFLALRFRVRGLGGRSSIPMIARVAFATVVMAIWVSLVGHVVGGPERFGAVLRVVAGVAVGTGLLYVALTLLKVREVEVVTSKVRGRLARGRQGIGR
jgi:putative peptidoglycan lipid II flippase